jgi:hypothetical protein
MGHICPVTLESFNSLTLMTPYSAFHQHTITMPPTKLYRMYDSDHSIDSQAQQDLKYALMALMLCVPSRAQHQTLTLCIQRFDNNIDAHTSLKELAIAVCL